MMHNADRLPRWRAALVVARRDFVAVLFSRAFFFFLLGPLFPVVVAGMAGGLGHRVANEAGNPTIGVAMEAGKTDAMIAAGMDLAPRLGGALPTLVPLARLEAGEEYDATASLTHKPGNLAAVVTGTPDAPILTGPSDAISRWEAPLALVAATAAGHGPGPYPTVSLAATATSGAKAKAGQIATAQGAQVLLFLLTMLLAGMVLSNLVEEKGNKIIEILAAAIPLDALFLGKLFAMLGVSLVGISVWGSVGGGIVWAGRAALPVLPDPAVGWPVFLALGVIYFAMAYLLLGSLFLAIGSMAATVREVQTLSMPVTMMQLLVYFFATYALTRPGSAVEWAAIVFPLSSPFTMLAKAAISPALFPHLAAIAWQAFSVAVFIHLGARLFRRVVMYSGSAPRQKRQGLLARLRLART
ncbi:MAG: ABC transporter permease [Novosphingobium sp.]